MADKGHAKTFMQIVMAFVVIFVLKAACDFVLAAIQFAMELAELLGVLFKIGGTIVIAGAVIGAVVYLVARRHHPEHLDTVLDKITGRGNENLSQTKTLTLSQYASRDNPYRRGAPNPRNNRGGRRDRNPD